MNDPGSILGIARKKLDFTQPVAIMLMGMLGHIGNPAEDDDAYTQSIVATLRAALPSGGYFALNEAVDSDQDANKALDDYNQTGAVPYRARRRDQIVRFFDGLELVDPGIGPDEQAERVWPEPGRMLVGADDDGTAFDLVFAVVRRGMKWGFWRREDNGIGHCQYPCHYDSPTRRCCAYSAGSPCPPGPTAPGTPRSWSCATRSPFSQVSESCTTAKPGVSSHVSAP